MQCIRKVRKDEEHKSASCGRTSLLLLLRKQSAAKLPKLV